ncbi:hypothetical protein OG547_35175 [Streptomyces longwoodensis]|uniref:hypothetical protein n=1 Tax=Streptomyces longwoodensis TaxID=68231 RepID=UPI002ED60E49|nr:hypothetical protein OG547_00105 [Streptomyces longwoodensis]WTI49395.1 hypothetical protein OG547_35175 [Streptomyces longwoodensis]
MRALARLGDTRAVPSLLAALDNDVDAWRAVEVAGHLSQAADEVVPRLSDHLRRIDLSQQWTEMSANAILAALAAAALGDPAAVPAVVDVLGAAAQRSFLTAHLCTYEVGASLMLTINMAVLLAVIIASSGAPSQSRSKFPWSDWCPASWHRAPVRFSGAHHVCGQGR